MSRKYRHISEYETKIISMVNQGYTLREIGNKLGFTYNEIQNLKTRYNKKQIIVEAGKTLKKKDDRVKKRRYQKITVFFAKITKFHPVLDGFCLHIQ